MKKLLILSLLAIALMACKEEPVAQTIRLNQAALQMKVGDIEMLEVIDGRGDITWKSSNEDVATVFNGAVQALAIGKAVISANLGEAEATCEVFVSGTDGATLRITPALVNLKKGETYQFRYGNTFDMPLTWTSSDESIATINQEGLCTAVGAGNATITLATDLGEVTALVAVEHEWGEYHLVWSEEFEGTSLDMSVWNIEVNGNGGGNNEKQYYTDRPENIRVQNGNLELEVRKESYNGKEYTSGRINTRDKKDFLYGKVEARIKFPGGKGTWPAFWMLGSNMNIYGWPKCGEIDIIEHIGSQDTRASFALHTKDKNGSKGNNWVKTHFFDAPLSADYHVYGIEWIPEVSNGRDEIRFFVDNELYATATESQIDNADVWPFNKPEFIILNLAIGGNMGGSIDDNIFSQQRIMYVDWVRVYQREEK